jgi:hypothetical protein
MEQCLCLFDFSKWCSGTLEIQVPALALLSAEAEYYVICEAAKDVKYIFSVALISLH